VAKLLTVNEVAVRLGLTTEAVRLRIRRGDMKAERIGARLLLIQEREVKKWQQIGRLKTGPKPKQNRRPRKAEDE
jgi:excisionase family DNA binding protein